MGLLSQFSIRLVCGMCLVLAAMPQATVASGFFRTQMLIVMGLSTLAALAGGSAGALPVGWQAVAGMQTGLHIALAILAFYGSVLWTLERRKGATAVLWGLAAAALAALLLGVSGLPTFQNSAVGLLVVSEVSSAVLLGAAM